MSLQVILRLPLKLTILLLILNLGKLNFELALQTQSLNNNLTPYTSCRNIL